MSLTTNTNNQMGTGSSSFTSPPNTVIQDSTDRHDSVDNCRHTQGFTEGRESLCVICQEEMEPTDRTVTHCECKNSFHEACFNELVDGVKADNLHNGERKPTKCPMCRGEMNEWPTLGCANEITAQADVDAARVEARRAAIETQEGLPNGTRTLRLRPTSAPPLPRQEVLLSPYRPEAQQAILSTSFRQLFALNQSDIEGNRRDRIEYLRQRENRDREMQEQRVRARVLRNRVARESILQHLAEARQRNARTGRVPPTRRQPPTRIHTASFSDVLRELGITRVEYELIIRMLEDDELDASD